MDLATLIARMRREGYFAMIALNLLAQFGTRTRRYIGAELMPERIVMQNAYREYGIRYRTIIANDGTRYGPVQKKRGDLVGDFMVELGNSDIGREMEAREYDMLIEALGRQLTPDAMARVTGWADLTLNRALIEHNERQRWMAICDALIIRRGDNDYYEEVPISNPTGHRVNAAGLWSDDTYDPYENDILPMKRLLESKGYTIRRIITSGTVLSIMAGNAKIQARTGSLVAQVGGAISVVRASADQEALGRMFQRDDLPAPEKYDLQFRTQTGAGFFLPRNVFVFVCSTDRDETIDLGDQGQIVRDNVIGYQAVGRAAGQPAPGRVVRAEAFENKPPRVEGEGWQTSLSVIVEPEAIGCIKGIA